MRKKLLMILVCGVLLIGMTGCGDKGIKENSNNSNASIKDNIVISRTPGYHDGYAWIKSEQLENEWAIVDTTGKVIFSENNVYPSSNVYGNHFIAADFDGSTVKSNVKYYLYDIKGNLLYTTGENGLTAITIKGKEDGSYVAVLSYEKNTFDGTEKTTEYVDLANMKFITIEDKDLLDVYANQLDGIKRPDFIEQKVNGPQLVTKAKYKCLENNGFFTIEENGTQLFEPIEGNVLALDSKNIAVLASCEDGYYIVDQAGAKEKVNISDIGTFITMYDGIITHQINSGTRNYEIIKVDGTKIEISK